MTRTTITLEIIITAHAYKRAKERLGLDHNATDRMAVKAFVAGLKHSDCKAKLKKYVDWLFLQYKKCGNIRIYGEAVWLFTEGTLVTILNLPNEYKKLAKK